MVKTPINSWINPLTNKLMTIGELPETVTETEPGPEMEEVMLAGSPFKVTKDQVEGSFHAIPLDLWAAIVGFHRKISIDHRAESFSYHRWHEKTQCYHTLIPHQKTSGNGLSVWFNWEDEANVKLLDAYGAAYGEDFFDGACTIHTHVDISAFESGTDAKDEEGQPGWHITLGELISKTKYDLDFRFRIPRIPRLKALTDTDCAYGMQWFNLFAKGTMPSEVFSIPGTTDFHHLLDRVTITNRWEYK